MKDPNNPIARQNGLVVQEMPDEVLVYDLDANKAHCLNSSAALIWKSCDGTKSVADIVDQFESNGGGKVSEDFVWLAIDQLNENNLLVGKVAPRFASQSRRQVLKTIGQASMVALPVIASLVAPPRALGNLSCVCTDPGQTTQCITQSGCQNFRCGGNGQCIP